MSNEESNLVDEVWETLRRVLQHMIFVALLTLRLWTLPLLYLCHRVSQPTDLLPSLTWFSMAGSSGAILARLPTRFRRAGSQSLHTTALQVFHTGVTIPFRVLRTLYNLGYVLDQHPETLRYSRPSVANDDNQTVSIIESEGSGEQKHDFEAEAPATASQVYHAAILNGATLDNLLAVFEVSDDQDILSQTIRAEGDPRPEPERTRYRNSSIQTTPDSAMMPRDSSKILREPNQDESSGIVERTYGHLVKATANDSQPEQGNGSPDLLSSPGSSDCCQAGGDVTQGGVYENMSPEHAECPTFARRQAKSRLPQRAKSEAKQRQPTDVKAVSANVNANADSPSRRNKLQRRPRVVG